jgi:hypothetical protein
MYNQQHIEAAYWELIDDLATHPDNETFWDSVVAPGEDLLAQNDTVQDQIRNAWPWN